ncbi:MAG: hypothetical protein IPK48_00410 [Gammaproteobacteria bacterium]|nr:hypothetical protein [Gammaproteobacteria bacterium]
MAAKEADDRAKQLEKWNAQIAAKKLTPAERDERLSQHAELWFGKTENDIARKIERAHLYSFNLPNYRSSLGLAQIEGMERLRRHPCARRQWRNHAGSKISRRRCRPHRGAGRNVVLLDPRHTLELDWARQFLTCVPAEEFKRHPHLNTLQEIIASQAKAGRIQLKTILEPCIRPIRLDPETTYRLVTVRLYRKGVQLRRRNAGERSQGANWYSVGCGDIIMSKIDARNGAFGIIPNELDGAIVTNEFPIFRVTSPEWQPEFVIAMLTSPLFYQRFDAMVSGASGRRRVEPSEFLAMEIPNVPSDIQKALGGRLIELHQTIASAEAEVCVIEQQVNELMES